MKQYICLLAVFGICLQVTHGFEESELDQTDLKCLEELNYDKSVVLNSYDKDNVIVEGNERMNKFFECAWKKDGLLKDDGTFNLDNLEKMVKLKLDKLYPDSEKYRAYLAKESIKACKDVKGNGNGDTCVKAYNCLLKKVGEISEKVKPADVQ